MNRRMLTRWSQEYVNAYFRSTRAKDPLLGRFKQEFERAVFLEAVVGLSVAGLHVSPLDDGHGVRLTGATPESLLEVVRLAAQCGGEILFPGALDG